MSRTGLSVLAFLSLATTWFLLHEELDAPTLGLAGFVVWVGLPETQSQ